MRDWYIVFVRLSVCPFVSSFVCSFVPPWRRKNVAQVVYISANTYSKTLIAQPADVDYKHCVSSSVRDQLVKMRITLESHINFDHIFHTYACQYWHAKQPFMMGYALLNISPSGRGQFVKMFITLEPHGIF